MIKQLDPSIFIDSPEFIESEFQDICSKIVECYKMMLSDNIKVKNDENQIRDLIYLNYLNNDKIRAKVGLLNYLFDREVLEDNSKGKTDIKIITTNTFLNTSAYYIIECKRLNKKNPTGQTGLNAEYIKNGIMRFVEGKYSTYNKLNAMIGFIVDQMDIQQNIQNINTLLNEDIFLTKTETVLSTLTFIKNFEYQYYSIHRDSGNRRFKLYHLMFDFSKNLM